jgi:hypothetical protein
MRSFGYRPSHDRGGEKVKHHDRKADFGSFVVHSPAAALV